MRCARAERECVRGWNPGESSGKAIDGRRRACWMADGGNAVYCHYHTVTKASG